MLKSYPACHNAPMESLKDKVAVVTGAASGIGLSMARAFGHREMKVVLADIEAAQLEAARAELAEAGIEAVALSCDVSDPAAVEALRDGAVEAFGTVHVVCNNAGVGAGGPLWEIPLPKWKWVFGVNFWGVVHGISAFVPLLLAQGEGHVVNTASAAGLVTVPFMGPYTTSKHAVVALTEALSMELALAGGTVGASVLCPMWVKTRIAESERNAPGEVLASEGAGAAGFGADLVAGLVAGGMEPDDVAAQVVSAIEESRFYVLPHEEVKQGVKARSERIERGEAPVLEFPS